MLRILESQTEIDLSRTKLRAMGCDTTHGWRRRMFQFANWVRFRAAAPDVAIEKSWDVLNMLETIEVEKPDRSAQIFEMGSYNSEILLALWQRGYRRIHASDFNPLGRCIRWYGNSIDFRAEDFYAPDLKPGSVDVIVALSVIEHGFDGDRLWATFARLLKPGGIALVSTDYHEAKIPIDPNFRAFNLSYTIFSRAEIEEMMRIATQHGLEPLGSIAWRNSQNPIEFEGHRFTFALMGFRKVANH